MEPLESKLDFSIGVLWVSSLTKLLKASVDILFQKNIWNHVKFWRQPSWWWVSLWYFQSISKCFCLQQRNFAKIHINSIQIHTRVNYHVNLASYSNIKLVWKQKIFLKDHLQQQQNISKEWRQISHVVFFLDFSFTWKCPGPNFVELLEHKKVAKHNMLIIIRLPVKPCLHMYNLWLVLCSFLLSRQWEIFSA